MAYLSSGLHLCRVCIVLYAYVYWYVHNILLGKCELMNFHCLYKIIILLYLYVCVHSNRYISAVVQQSESCQMMICSLLCRGLSCGVYSTIGKDELHQIARKVHTAVAVVETHSMLCKFLLVSCCIGPCAYIYIVHVLVHTVKHEYDHIWRVGGFVLI